jgi:hypothetical protein
MRRIRVAGALTAMLVSAAVGLAQGERTFRARLSTVPRTVQMQETVDGVGQATATLSGSTLTITGTFEGLKTPATVARLHVGRKGVRGPAVAELQVTPAVKGVISGSVELTREQLEALANGGVYIQIHSEKAPEGNLWGWLLPQESRR